MGNDHKKKDPMDQLFDASFEMKQHAKMLEKEAKKVESQATREKAKVQAVR